MLRWRPKPHLCCLKPAHSSCGLVHLLRGHEHLPHAAHGVSETRGSSEGRGRSDLRSRTRSTGGLKGAWVIAPREDKGAGSASSGFQVYKRLQPATLMSCSPYWEHSKQQTDPKGSLARGPGVSLRNRGALCLDTLSRENSSFCIHYVLPIERWLKWMA